MFMSFFIREAPSFEILSCDFFRSVRNFLAVLFFIWVFSRACIAFWRSGSVGRVSRICFTEALSFWRR